MTASTTLPTEGEPRIVWSDDALVAIDKPHGQLSVPGRGSDKLDCAWSRVRTIWPDALVVHRLDQATSGLMLFARGVSMQRRLSRAFAQRHVLKQYVAVVEGTLREDTGRIDLPLAADWPRRPLQHVDPSAGKAAITEWTVLARDPALLRTRLALRPLTGRTHQLRVHLAAIGHAIVGDALYAPDAPPREGRLLLHANELRLVHPLNGSALLLSCQTPF